MLKLGIPVAKPGQDLVASRRLPPPPLQVVIKTKTYSVVSAVLSPDKRLPLTTFLEFSSDVVRPPTPLTHTPSPNPCYQALLTTTRDQSSMGFRRQNIGCREYMPNDVALSLSFFFIHLGAILGVHALGEPYKRRRGRIVFEPALVFQPQGVREVEQGDHGLDAGRQQSVDLLVIVGNRRLFPKPQNERTKHQRRKNQMKPLHYPSPFKISPVYLTAPSWSEAGSP